MPVPDRSTSKQKLCYRFIKQAYFVRSIQQSGDLLGDSRGDKDGISFLFQNTPDLAKKLHSAYKSDLNPGTYTDGLFGRKGGITPMTATRMLSDIHAGNDRGNAILKAITEPKNNARVQSLLDRLGEDYGKYINKDSLSQAREAIGLAPVLNKQLTDPTSALYSQGRKAIQDSLKAPLSALKGNTALKMLYGPSRWNKSFSNFHSSSTPQVPVVTSPIQSAISKTVDNNGDAIHNIAKYMLPMLAGGGVVAGANYMLGGDNKKMILPMLLGTLAAGAYGYGRHKGLLGNNDNSFNKTIDNATNFLWNKGSDLYSQGRSLFNR